MSVALGSRTAAVVSPSCLSSAASALHARRSLHGVEHRLSLITTMLGSLELDRKSLTQLFDVDFAVSRVANHAHESRLERLDLAALREEPLQVFIDASLLDLELLILVL